MNEICKQKKLRNAAFDIDFFKVDKNIFQVCKRALSATDLLD